MDSCLPQVSPHHFSKALVLIPNISSLLLVTLLDGDTELFTNIRQSLMTEMHSATAAQMEHFPQISDRLSGSCLSAKIYSIVLRPSSFNEATCLPTLIRWSASRSSRMTKILDGMLELSGTFSARQGFII
jgi:hypothetical protein